MKTNIVLLAKDRPELTHQALWSLEEHTDPDAYNLTIIDDQSKIPVRGAHPNFCSLPNVCVLRIETSKGITGQARNLGVYFSEKYFGRGDFLYLSDNDVCFLPDWLPVLKDAMRHTQGKVGVLGGSTHPYHQPNGELPQTLIGHMGPCSGAYSVLRRDAVSGYSHFMPWAVWDACGPLEANAAGVAQSEDFAFCQRAIKAGYEVVALDPPIVLNCGVTNTHGEPMTGHEAVLEQLKPWRAKIPGLAVI